MKKEIAREREVHRLYQPDLLKREVHARHDSQTKWAISVGQEGPGMQEGDLAGQPPGTQHSTTEHISSARRQWVVEWQQKSSSQDLC